MAAPTGWFNFGSTPELSGDDDQGLLQHAPVSQVADERADALIEHGQVELVQIVHGAAEGGGMGIPALVNDGMAAPVHLDEAGAGADQAAGHQAALAEIRVAVFLAQLWRLLAEIEGALGFGRGDEREGPLVGHVPGAEPVGLAVRLELIQRLENALASAHPARGDALRQ